MANVLAPKISWEESRFGSKNVSYNTGGTRRSAIALTRPTEQASEPSPTSEIAGMRRVVIRGDGIAACCCAHLLRVAGFRVVQEKADRAKVPSIMLSQSTQALIAGVFERNDLFKDLPRIEKRIVVWGPGSKPIALPHSSVLVSEKDLSARLLPGPLGDGQERDAEAEWVVLASRSLPPSAIEHHFGTRMAVALAVKVKDDSDASACWIESLEAGWLFLTPGWLLAVGSDPESLLPQSRVVAAQIHETRSTPLKFPAYPRVADPLCGHGWLACGTAALAFDPLCGDGVGNAIREAILAAAVIRAIAEGANVDGVLAHYRGRLLGGFTRHLELCRQFYAAGNAGPWWDSELEQILKGIKWCGRKRETATRFRYRLNGFELQTIPDPA